MKGKTEEISQKSSSKGNLTSHVDDKISTALKESISGMNDYINIQKRENIRKSILHWTKKYYSQRSTTSTNEPDMAFSKFDIQRLLNGYKEPLIPGFGSADLFNNPELRK